MASDITKFAHTDTPHAESRVSRIIITSPSHVPASGDDEQIQIATFFQVEVGDASRQGDHPREREQADPAKQGPRVPGQELPGCAASRRLRSATKLESSDRKKKPS